MNARDPAALGREGYGQVRLFLEHLPDILAIGQRLSDAEAPAS
jgi:hypothetical protein